MSERTGTAGRRPSASPAPKRGFFARLSTAVVRVRDRVRDAVRSLVESTVPRAVGWLRARFRPAARLARTLFMATIGKDRGFAFWWLLATGAIALLVGLLVAALLSPVIGIIAALVVAIWMLIRRNRSAQSRQPQTRLAN